MNKTSKKGFALLLFGIMLSPMVLLGGVFQIFAMGGWIAGFIGLIIVFSDSGDEKIDNSIDNNQDRKIGNFEDGNIE